MEFIGPSTSISASNEKEFFFSPKMTLLTSKHPAENSDMESTKEQGEP